jgi:hypothetical protein
MICPTSTHNNYFKAKFSNYEEAVYKKLGEYPNFLNENAR